MTGRIASYEIRHFIQSKTIRHCCFSVKSELMFFSTDNGSYITFDNSRVYITQLVIYDRYKSAHCFIDTGSNISAIRLYLVTVDVNIGIFQCLFQKDNGLIFMFTQFRTLIAVDLFVFGGSSSGISSEKILYFQ